MSIRRLNTRSDRIMPELIPVLSREEIKERIAGVAVQISKDYENRELVLIGVLKGAFVFLSDLIRHLTIPVQLDFVSISSYGSGTASTGEIRLTKDLGIAISGKDVLIVEDIIDSGQTLQWLSDYLRTLDPKSVRTCTFIDKRERREENIPVDYACHTVEEGFLVGYGLDYAEDYRYLPGIYHLKL
ncbi:Hypoxanthine-guanine phosphoribosyltransferase (EC [Olavius algarvensis associated proteobacterium Delta 3]|nr:Hypoxanthine-guanine phosphoribosyltransferase (EC [Olavius algarvensis associated proteobacterium Delta 3]CAB5135301.1 Hypoxanthine-guanine phosphoribosyltransferase (EC [Olavius algarvensis associated proteobacterium Delta 3]